MDAIYCWACGTTHEEGTLGVYLVSHRHFDPDLSVRVLTHLVSIPLQGRDLDWVEKTTHDLFLVGQDDRRELMTMTELHPAEHETPR